MLIAWKQGDLAEARQCFSELRATDPETLRTINVARLPQTPRRFEEFAGYCCASPACGPYMKDACHALALDVREREISKETVLKELRIEMEKQRRLRKVYEQRKELEIEIEPERLATEPPPASASAIPSSPSTRSGRSGRWAASSFSVRSAIQRMASSGSSVKRICAASSREIVPAAVMCSRDELAQRRPVLEAHQHAGEALDLARLDQRRDLEDLVERAVAAG